MSLRRQAPINNQLAASHKRRLVRGKEQHAISDVLRLAQTPRRNELGLPTNAKPEDILIIEPPPIFLIPRRPATEVKEWNSTSDFICDLSNYRYQPMAYPIFPLGETAPIITPLALS